MELWPVGVIGYPEPRLTSGRKTQRSSPAVCVPRRKIYLARAPAGEGSKG